MREEATKHREEVGERLMAELRRQGVECKKDGVMGAYYVDLEGHRGFTLEVDLESVKAEDRPPPFNYDYTGRTKIGYQGFGQRSGTDILEPEGGFNLPGVASLLVREAEESTARLTAFEARKAQAEQQATTIVDGFLESDLTGTDWGPAIEGYAFQKNGDWEPRFEVSFEGLTEAEARSLLVFAREFRKG